MPWERRRCGEAAHAAESEERWGPSWTERNGSETEQRSNEGRKTMEPSRHAGLMKKPRLAEKRKGERDWEPVKLRESEAVTLRDWERLRERESLALLQQTSGTMSIYDQDVAPPPEMMPVPPSHLLFQYHYLPQIAWLLFKPWPRLVTLPLRQLQSSPACATAEAKRL